jgi:hypothetical protein
MGRQRIVLPEKQPAALSFPGLIADKQMPQYLSTLARKFFSAAVRG